MAINTDAQLTLLAEQIRDETQIGANTKLRIYTALKNIIDSKANAGTGIAPVIMGDYNAASGNYPSTGGSGTAGAIRKGDMFDISVASPADGGGNIKFPLGATLRAKVDTPGQTDASWRIYY